MNWIFRSATDSFRQYRNLWDAINRCRGDHLVLDSLFVEPLVDQFASAETKVAILDDNELPAMMLVEPGERGLWHTFQPSQAPVGLALFACQDGVVLAQQIRLLMHCLPSFTLGISVLQQDPDFSCLANLNGCMPWEKLDYINTPRLEVPENWETYWQSRSKNLTHNLSRQRRRLKEKGIEIEFAAGRDPAAVEVAIEEYGALESSGWKGKEGTAVRKDNRQGLFYKNMLENFCARGEAITYSLSVNGKMVARDLCLERDGRMIILKTAYDESIEGLSLGMLLHQELFRTLSQQRKIKIVEFYGRVREWHTKWTNDVRAMYHITFYRFGWVPGVRRILKKAAGFGFS